MRYRKSAANELKKHRAAQTLQHTALASLGLHSGACQLTLNAGALGTSMIIVGRGKGAVSGTQKNAKDTNLKLRCYCYCQVHHTPGLRLTA